MNVTAGMNGIILSCLTTL